MTVLLALSLSDFNLSHFQHSMYNMCILKIYLMMSMFDFKRISTLHVNLHILYIFCITLCGFPGESCAHNVSVH
jgi:hypothetical protein